MRTVKQVSCLTGISVRTLQYYDEIGLLKPACTTKAGYRLYDEAALTRLQQILFFKELGFSLKEIKNLMTDRSVDRAELFHTQKVLLRNKRDRINELLSLLAKLEKGETDMTFTAFDMSGYIRLLMQFKEENAADVEKYWGSTEKFDQFIQRIKEHESSVAKSAISQYGSIEKYTEAMKESMAHFPENMAHMEKLQQNSCELLEKSEALMRQLTADLTKDPAADEILSVMDELMDFTASLTPPGIDMGNGFYDMVIDGFANDPAVIASTNKKYGSGASKYLAAVYRSYIIKRKINGI